MKSEYRGSLLSQEILKKQRDQILKQRAQRLKEDLKLAILTAIIVAPIFAHLFELAMEGLQKLF